MKQAQRMSDTRHKRQLFSHLAVIAKALGHEYRLELLELLAQGERSVEALTQIMDLPVGNVSQHLQQLRRAGLILPRKDGRYVYYRLADEEVVSLLKALRTIAESNLAEVQRLVDKYVNVEGELERIPLQELVKRLRSGATTLLDVRPSDEYAAGHLPGALNIPLAELEERLRELSPDREVVAYCRGPYCLLANRAVALLRARGIHAVRLEEGYPQWRAEGFPVTRD